MVPLLGGARNQAAARPAAASIVVANLRVLARGSSGALPLSSLLPESSVVALRPARACVCLVHTAASRWPGAGGSPMLAALPVLLVLSACSLAAAAPSAGGWIPAADAKDGSDGTLQIPLAFALKLSEAAIAELEQTFVQVSDPAHERYGCHLTKAQLEQLLSSDKTTACRAVVEAWLQDSMAARNVVRLGVDGLHVTATLADIEKAFGITPLVPFRRRTGGPVVFRSAAAVLNMPDSVEACVDVVSGVLSSELSEVAKVAVTTGEKPSTWPATLAELYGLPANVPNGTGSRQATANFIGQYYAPSDLDAFFTKYAPDLVGRDTVELVGPGTNDPTDPGSEASLDLQCACMQACRPCRASSAVEWR